MSNCFTSKRVEKITPNDEYHYFFGYYDLYPYDRSGKFHLAHRVKFADRLPNEDDVCEVGVIDLDDKRFIRLGETTAWNFQQGAFLNWFSDNTIIYNAFIDGNLRSVVSDLNGNITKVISMPIASLSEDRKWGLSINFGRIFSFRAGYGYAAACDKNASINAPNDDGVFLVDLETGKGELLISYSELVEKCPEAPFTDDKMIINHVTFNPSGSSFLTLFRNKPENSGKRGTQVLIIDRNKNIRKITNFQVNSHYSWKNDSEFMIWSVLEEGQGVYFINALSGKRSRLNNEILNKDDIHCLFSPNKRSFIGDSYPYVDGYRHIYKYDFENGRVEDLIKVKHCEPKIGDIRCDLHARFHKNSKIISFDSYHEKYRGIYQLYLD